MTAEDRAAHVEREAVAGVLATAPCCGHHLACHDQYEDGAGRQGCAYRGCSCPLGFSAALGQRDAVLAALPQTGDAAAVASSGRPRNDRDGACICDYNPDTTDGPLEDCPFHGRPYRYWVDRSDSLAVAVAARVEALCDKADAVRADVGVLTGDAAIEAIRDDRWVADMLADTSDGPRGGPSATSAPEKDRHPRLIPIPDAECANCGVGLAWRAGVGRYVISHEDGDDMCARTAARLAPEERETALAALTAGADQ